ncbi:MAG TPA: DUF2157 domain-containing protein [Chloroflexi bacterium]|nr:DUF2157 domain-containing protein [Chloroflexota bacterium]
MDEHSSLDLPPSPENLRWLARNGILNAAPLRLRSGQALERALEISGHAPDRGRWLRFLDIILLVLGAGFAVSGIFFFFAFNWADMHRFFKLGLLEVAILAAVGLTSCLGLDKLAGKIALTASGLLVGALLAVYGQIYQTGADSYTLFLNWALLIAGWALIGQFAPLWVVWVLLFDLSLVFYWIQIVGDVNGQLYLWLFLLNGGAILAWEIASARGVAWLENRWTPRLLALPTFIALVAPTITLIFSSTGERSRDPLLFLMLALFIGASVATLYVYSQKILDLFMLTLCAFSLIIAFNAWVSETLDFEEFTLFLVSALFIGQAALIAVWLRRVSQQWEERSA